MLEDKLLIRRYNRGEAAVLHRIYDKYKKDLMTLATALLFDKTDAEDLVHDLFTALIRSCGERQIRVNLKGYLLSSTANRARNRNQAGQIRTTASLDQAESAASHGKGPVATGLLGEQRQQMDEALGRITYEQREVLFLHRRNRMTFKAIAETLGLSINTIQGRYRYGLAKLRSLLNGEVEK